MRITTISFAKHFERFLLGRVLGSVGGGLTTFFAAAVLGPSKFGFLAFCLAFIGIAVRLVSLGIGQAVQLSAARANGESITGCGALVLALGLSSLVGGVLLISWSSISSFLASSEGFDQEIFGIVLSATPFSMLGFIASLYFIGGRNVVVYNRVANFPVAVALVAVLAAFFFSNHIIVPYAHAASIVTGAVIGIVYLIRECYRRDGSRPGVGITPKLFIEGLPSFLVSLGSFVSSRIVLVALPWSLDPESVGNFAFARALGEISAALVGTVTPLLMSYSAAWSLDASRVLFLRLGRITLMVATLILLLIGLVGGLLTKLGLFSQYNEAIEIYYWLFPSFFFGAAQKFVENYLIGSGRPRYLIGAHVLALCGLGIGLSLITKGSEVWMFATMIVLYNAGLFLLCSFALKTSSSLSAFDLFKFNISDITEVAIYARRRLVDFFSSR